jgi:hypothetical protein
VERAEGAYLVVGVGVEDKAKQRQQDLNGGGRSLATVPTSRLPWQRRDRSDPVCEIAVAKTYELDRLRPHRNETTDVKDSRDVHSFVNKLLDKTD